MKAEKQALEECLSATAGAQRHTPTSAQAAPVTPQPHRTSNPSSAKLSEGGRLLLLLLEGSASSQGCYKPQDALFSLSAANAASRKLRKERDASQPHRFSGAL